jgi:hypothetical protein
MSANHDSCKLEATNVGWVCLSIDGACRNGVIGCGGVIVNAKVVSLVYC